MDAENMDRFMEMQVFVAVAEEEGFAAAARRLNVSPPAVTRAVSSLEDSLGVKLLSRSTRHVRTTEVGQRYLEDARRILHDLQVANESAAGVNAEPQGRLVVTAPVMFGSRYVMPGIVEFLQRYPKTDVDALFYDRVVNLLEEGVDVGVRIGPLSDSSMRALPVGMVRLVLVASPAYLEQHGPLQTPLCLEKHTLIQSRGVSFGRDWRFRDSEGDHFHKVKPRLLVSSNDAAINAVMEGLGVCRLLSYQVADELASGALCAVLEPYEPAPIPIHIIHHESRLVSVKVRAFIDLMANRLRAHPALGYSA